MSNRSTRTSRARFWESPLFWLVGLIGFALVATLILSAGDDDDAVITDEPQTAAVELDGAPLPPFTQPDNALGLTAPTFTAQTFDGGRVQLEADGTARLYGFFAHWCPHCQRELPRVADWLDTHDLPDGVEVVAISTAVQASADNYPPSVWFEREAWPALALLDDANSSIANGFGLMTFPYWVVVDGDGAVVTRASGELSTAQFEELLATVSSPQP